VYYDSCPGHEAFEEVDKSIYTDALVEAMKRSLASKEPTAIRSIIDEAEKQTKTRCEELREELRQKLHLKNMYPTHREVSGSEGRKISLSCPCDVSNEAHVMNKEKIRKLCHGTIKLSCHSVYFQYIIHLAFRSSQRCC
jgi:hypothetical protein